MDPRRKDHFVGVAGAGMSALAQFHAMQGGRATGSDRLLDRGEASDVRAALERLGVSLFPQDGSGLNEETARLVVSTAIENDNAEFARAKALGIPVVHRADALAAHVAGHRTLAVAGTSGKSTVTAMAYEILAAAGKSPSVITGAPLVSLQARGLWGNTFKGESDFLVIEADESDGTLPKYAPEIGLLLNLSLDHKPLPELREIFSRFRSRCKKFVVCADYENLAEFSVGARTYGFTAGQVRAEALRLSPDSCEFTAQGARFRLPMPGRHNAENALAAACACLEAGVSLQESAKALASFKGVARRFQVVGEKDGVVVIDDYAHNPEKVAAALAAARLRAGRLLVVFQPHGFAPTRLLKDGFVAAFKEALSGRDVLWLAPIYYAGGTAAKDISSEHLAVPLREAGKDARSPSDRAAIPAEISREARAGDAVLVLGARDPGLTRFAEEILGTLP